MDSYSRMPYKDLDLAADHRLQYGDRASLVSLIRRYEAYERSDVIDVVLRRLRADLSAADLNGSWSDTITSLPTTDSANQTLAGLSAVPYVFKSQTDAQKTLSDLAFDPFFTALISMHPEFNFWAVVLDRLSAGSWVIWTPSAGGIYMPGHYQGESGSVVFGDRLSGKAAVAISYSSSDNAIIAYFANRSPARINATLFDVLCQACISAQVSDRARECRISKKVVGDTDTITILGVDFVFGNVARTSDHVAKKVFAPGYVGGDVFGLDMEYIRMDTAWLQTNQFTLPTSPDFIRRVEGTGSLPSVLSVTSLGAASTSPYQASDTGMVSLDNYQVRYS